MLRIFSFLSLFFAATFSAQVNWMTLEEAVKAQQTVPKKIMIDFYADWCAPCKIMDKKTFNHPVIAAKLAQDFYAVKFNAEGNDSITIFGQTFTNPGFQKKKNRNTLHEFTRYMNVNAVPTVVFLDEKSMPITLLHGALTAKELEPYLPFIATDEFKKINSRDKWDSYQKKFKSSIKD